MSEHNIASIEPGTDPCPIHTLDESIAWMAANDCDVDFNAGAVTVICGQVVKVSRVIGTGGFDARGTLMMACRELWALTNKANP